MKLALFIPSSKIYPSLTVDFVNGVKYALEKFNASSNIELIFHSIGVGTNKDEIAKAMNDMVIQDNIDAFILYVNTIILEDLAPTIEGLKRPVMISNIGANIWFKNIPTNYVLTNSYNLWESAYQSAQWGIHKWGKKIAHGSYFYEAGYQIYESFIEGTKPLDGEIVFNQISELNPNPDDFNIFMESIKEDTPDFLYMVYSERDAYTFLNKLTDSPYNGTYPIISSGTLIDDDCLEKLTGYPEEIYNVTSWDISLDTPENTEFTKGYESFYGEVANYFSLLGYECGATFAHAVKSEQWSKNGQQQFEILKNTTVEGPRGTIEFSNENHSTQYNNYVFKLNKDLKRTIVDKLGKLDHKHQLIQKKQQEDKLFGWLQPYLCQ